MAYIYDCQKDFNQMSSFCYGDIFVWNKDKIYVMDNHKNALWCWMQQCKQSERYNFMHIDRHYDLLDCYSSKDICKIRDNVKMSFEEYRTLKSSNEDSLLRFDNYIYLGVDSFPDWFKSAIFITQRQGSNEGWKKHNLRYIEEEPTYMNHILDQYLIEPSENLYGITPGCANAQWIVNLDIDSFFDEDYNHVRVFSDDFIRCISDIIFLAMQNIAVLTIAISPDFLSGSEMCDKMRNGIKVLQVMSEKLPALCEVVEDWEERIARYI